jgi:hypothetical protein
VVDEHEAATVYRLTLEAQGELGQGTSKVKRWNRLHDENHRAYLMLRSTPGGRREIEALLGHRDDVVRLGAAAHAILWNERDARPVLEEVAAKVGLVAFTAEMVLREFDGGRLSHD